MTADPRIGWQWCPGARGICSECKTMAEGLWRYFQTPTTSILHVCHECAQSVASSSA